MNEVYDLLRAAIPSRFMNVTPHHFEEFICQLFKDSGYHAELTQQSGDFGADVILEKDQLKTAIQVKRYDQGRKVGVKEVNQVVGARDFYRCDKALVITTSSFTKPAIELAQETQIELWDWGELYEKIKDVYLEGKEVYEFFSEEDPKMSERPEALSGSESQESIVQDDFEFRIDRIKEEVAMQNKTTATIVYVGMKNLSNKKTNVTVKAFPVLIDSLGNQFSAYCWLSGGFVFGDIYPHASVPIISCWHDWQVPQASTIDRVIIHYAKGEDGETREITIKVPESLRKAKPTAATTSGCFIVTFCFGKDSREYQEMIAFRDEVLSKSIYGRSLIRLYYEISPWLIRLARRYDVLASMLRKGVLITAQCVRRFWHHLSA